ncbi:MAG: hypothetical protein DI576_14475 [Actinomyces sp.]|nr:MAG: hypothetical protein DI576_14475 [Actinomyces sp.]
MTQPPNPGQPYIPPTSAPSAPGTYNPQQQFAAQNTQYVPTGAVPQPGMAPSGDSIFTNLFDVTRAFAAKYGTVVMIVGSIGFALSWLYTSYKAGVSLSFSSLSGSEFDVGKFLIDLLVNLPWVLTEILGLRLVLEIAAKVGGPAGGRQG